MLSLQRFPDGILETMQLAELSTVSKRLDDVRIFYNILSILENRLGARRLGDCHGRMRWPKRGVYFFFEEGEQRSTSGAGLRVVRVGTHAVSEGAKSRLWDRLSSHRGAAKSGGGSHRVSVFRRLLGEALSEKSRSLKFSTWGKGMTATRQIREIEKPLERIVSQYIREMKVLWIEANDEPSKNSVRKFIERNSIALLSNHKQQVEIDPFSSLWLGKYSRQAKVRLSGLWNSDHVDEDYNPAFLGTFRDLVQQMARY